MANEVCTKCKRDAPRLVTTGGRSRLCPACFDRYVRTKYLSSLDVWRRESIGRKDNHGSSASQPPRPVLVPVSGGPCSAALAYLLYDSWRRTNGRSPEPILIHFDDAAYTGRHRDDIATTLRWLQRQFSGVALGVRSMDGSVMSLDALRDGATADDTTATTPVLARTLSSLRSKTSQEDLIEIQRSHLYLQAARQCECGAIMLGDSATRLAGKALSLVAQGRGERLAEDIAETVRLDGAGGGDMWLLRPNKRLLHSELLAFARQIGVPMSAESVKDDRPDSIGNLTQKYFSDLEAQFPSLVNTVARITDKLVRRDGGVGDEVPCTICRSSVATDSNDWDTRIVIDRLDRAVELGEKSDEQVPPLCYGCRVTFTDADESIDWDAISEARRALNDCRRQATLDEYELPDEN